MSKKVLVTGAAGFIGSHLSEQLVVNGYEVVGIDNLSSGRIENLSKLSSANFKFIESDIAKSSLSQYYSELNNVQFIFHLAAKADIVPSIKNPREYFETNVSGTLNLLEFAREHDVKKFVYAASSSCYGIPSLFPTPESAPISPQYPYALTKFLGEELALHWGKVYKIPVVSLRLFNVYGPRARTSGTYGAVFGVFLAQRRSGLPLTIVGDGTQTRDFTYVSDVVDAFLRAAEHEAFGEIYNVGSGGTYSVNHLAELLGGDVTKIPKRPGEPDCTFADIEKIERLLNWRPKISFEEGVMRMLQDSQSWRDAPVWTPEKIATETELWFRYLGEETR